MKLEKDMINELLPAIERKRGFAWSHLSEGATLTGLEVEQSVIAFI